MKRILSLCISAVAALIFVAAVTPARVLEPIKSEPVKVVFVKDGQIFYRAGLETADIQLTGEDSIKFLPVWSSDGLNIAFAERKVGTEGLGRLVVIDERGRRLEEIELGEGGGGGGEMRYIESLEWVSGATLAVSGSANPSLTETRLIDLNDLDAKESILDDGPGADFSPDGKHFAYMTGSPHFTPEKFREPALNIDFRRVFPEEGVQVRFLTERVWSPDSGALAVIAEDVSTEALTLVIWRTNTGLERRPLKGLSASDIQGLFWSTDAVLLRTTAGVKYPAKGGLESWSSASPDKAQLGVELRESLSRRLEGSGRTSPDFWCGNCALNASHRKVTIAQ